MKTFWISDPLKIIQSIVIVINVIMSIIYLFEGQPESFVIRDLSADVDDKPSNYSRNKNKQQLLV